MDQHKRKTLIIGALSVLASAFGLYALYVLSASDHKIFTISLIAFFAGLLYESIRVMNNWETVQVTFLSAFGLSILSLTIVERGHNFSLEAQILAWPYWFIGFYAVIFGVIYREQTKAKLTEGVTLLQSLALMYWIINYGFANVHHWFGISLLGIVLLFSAFSLFNALTYIHLSETARVILSIWSSVIMLTFAVDNGIRVLSTPDIETVQNLSEKFNLGLQFFLLGVSIVYGMYNFMLLIEYLPSKTEPYHKVLKDNKEEHLRRYSAEQVLIGRAILCIVYAGIMFGLNYRYHFIPRQTMIWLVFFSFPIWLDLIKRVQQTIPGEAVSRP